jgi:predicted GTPase
VSIREVAPGAGAAEVARRLHELGVDHGGADVAVVDALRPGLAALAAGADVVVVTRVDLAPLDAVERIAALVGDATVVPVASPVELEPGPPLLDAAVVVVEDGAAVTVGGLPFGAATLAAQQAQVGMRIDARDDAVGAVADAYELYPHLTLVVPAVEPLRDVERTLDAVDCDAVIAATDAPLRTRHPLRRARFGLRELGVPLGDAVRLPALRS